MLKPVPMCLFPRILGGKRYPNLLRKRFGSGIQVVNVCGNDFPAAQAGAGRPGIHCGACMFNRKHVLSRIAAAEAAGVPITNYGVVLAKLGGILDKISCRDKTLRIKWPCWQTDAKAVCRCGFLRLRDLERQNIAGALWRSGSLEVWLAILSEAAISRLLEMKS